MCLAMSGQAQQEQLTFVPLAKDSVFQLDVLNTYQAVTIPGYIQNNSNRTLNVRWERNPIQVPAGWSIQIQDANKLYADFVDSNMDAEVYLNEPITLRPNERSRLDVHATANGTPGEMVLSIELYLAEQPEMIISAEDVKVNIKSNQYNTRRRNAIYPNPSSNFLKLAQQKDVERLVVYNIVGKKVRTFIVSDNTDYDISGLPDGIYMVGLFDERNQIIKTVRIQKRTNRP